MSAGIHLAKTKAEGATRRPEARLRRKIVMKHSGIFDTARRARRATGSAVLIALSALIAGCTSDGYEKLPPQAFDSDYKVFSVVGSLDGSDLDI